VLARGTGEDDSVGLLVHLHDLLPAAFLTKNESLTFTFNTLVLGQSRPPVVP